MTLRIVIDLLISIAVPVWVLLNYIFDSGIESAKFSLATLVIFVLVWFYVSAVHNPKILGHKKLIQTLLAAPLFLIVFCRFLMMFYIFR